MSKLYRFPFVATLALFAAPSLANNLGENIAWQFQSSADKVHQAAVQDMIQKKQSGYYAAPIYNTHVERQYNCNVTASSTGNQGANSMTANSPATNGSEANAIGNDNDTEIGYSGGSADSGQDNSGNVGASVFGPTRTQVYGWADQALNSSQDNSGNQYASVQGGTACQFAALN